MSITEHCSEYRNTPNKLLSRFQSTFTERKDPLTKIALLQFCLTEKALLLATSESLVVTVKMVVNSFGKS